MINPERNISDSVNNSIRNGIKNRKNSHLGLKLMLPQIDVYLRGIYQFLTVYSFRSVFLVKWKMYNYLINQYF